MTKEIDKLINKGVALFGQVPQTENKTVIVLGVARGSTSVIAGVLHKLGIFMGTGSRAPVYEDMRLSIAVENGNQDQIQEIVNDYNKKHAMWGWKRPSSINHIEGLNDLFRAPIYICIFKDIFAIANRNHISMNIDLLDGMSRALSEYLKIVDFLGNKRPNALLISAEKIQTNKRAIIDEICKFVGIEELAGQKKRKAEAFIEPVPKSYLTETRLTQKMGVVDKVTRKFVSGWAAKIGEETTVDVDIYVNDILRATVRANLLRKDVKQHGLHPTGLCGFRCDFKETACINPADKISVRFSHGNAELNKSPVIFGPAVKAYAQ